MALRSLIRSHTLTQHREILIRKNAEPKAVVLMANTVAVVMQQ